MFHVKHARFPLFQEAKRPQGRGAVKAGQRARKEWWYAGAKSGAERRNGMAKAQAVRDTKAAWQKRKRCGIQRWRGKSAGSVGYKGGTAKAQ